MADDAQQVIKSANLAAFAHMGDVYLYHQLFGFILKMSPDVLDFVDDFAEPRTPAAVCSEWASRLGGADPAQFVDVLLQFRCLVAPDEDEVAAIWDYVPVPGRWNVWRREDDGSLTLYCAWGDRPLTTHRLTPDEARLFESFDGERPLSARLGDGYQPAFVEALIRRLVQVDVQAVKLSPVPRSVYRGRRDLEPPYLTSTMPYPPYRGDARPVVDAAGTVSPASYYRDEVTDGDEQFDHQETTLAHLLRRPHPALANRTYGRALVDALAARDLLPDGQTRVLEIGGGLGYLAEAVVGALVDRGAEVDYQIVELSPVLAAAQRARCAALPVTVREADALQVELPEAAFDLIIANEMIGDLPAQQLGHADLERDDIRALVERYGLQLGDAPDPFWLTTGAFALVERAAGWLAPGGALFISEFGDLGRYPRLSTHLDHPELSIHFGLMEECARALGLVAEVAFVIDLIDLDRDAEGLATTRSYFRALTAMLADAGVTLEKVGYTRTMWDALIEGAIDPTCIGDVRFDKIEDRLMGLVPHEFKAVVARRPSH